MAHLPGEHRNRQPNPIPGNDLHPSFHDEPYAQTRTFHRRVGFTPLEEHDGIDWPGFSLILVGPLRRSTLNPCLGSRWVRDRRRRT